MRFTASGAGVRSFDSCAPAVSAPQALVAFCTHRSACGRMQASVSESRLQPLAEPGVHFPCSSHVLWVVAHGPTRVNMQEQSRTCEQVHHELDAAAGHEGGAIGTRHRARRRIIATQGRLRQQEAVQQPQQRVAQWPPRRMIQQR